MAKLSADAVRLRELAAKCRRLAALSADENDRVLFGKTGAEYEAMANRVERDRMPNQDMSPSVIAE